MGNVYEAFDPVTPRFDRPQLGGGPKPEIASPNADATEKPNIYAQFDAPEQSSSALRRYVADPALSLLKGAIAVPEAAVGLADIATGGHAGKIAEDLGFRPKEAKAILDENLSPEQREVNKGLAETKGFLPTVGYAVTHPSTIVHSAIESAPSTLAMGEVGRVVSPALRAAGMTELGAPVLGGAIGEGAQQIGQAAEQSRQESHDSLLTPKQAAAAVASGIIDTAIAFGGGSLAQKLGIGDIQTMLSRGKLTTASVEKAGQINGFAKRLVAGGISEGVFQELPQSAQEQLWQNYADDKPLMEGVAEAGAMGMLTGAMMGAPSAAVASPEAAPSVQPGASTPKQEGYQVAGESPK